MARRGQPDLISLHLTRGFFRKNKGQGMAEYGLILAGVALLAIVAVFLLGQKIGMLLNNIGSSLS